MNTMQLRWNQFVAIFMRQFTISYKTLSRQLIDYWMCWHPLFVLNNGYIGPRMWFDSPTPETYTIFLIGNYMFTVLLYTFARSEHLFYDYAFNKSLQVQVLAAPVSIVLAGRILFNALATTFLMVPYFIIAKLMLGSSILIGAQHFPFIIVVTFLTSIAGLLLFSIPLLLSKSEEDIMSVWLRVAEPMTWTGGFLYPFHIAYKVSPVFSGVMLLNPFLYLSESLRSIMTSSGLFISPTISLVVLGIMICVGMILTYSFAVRILLKSN